MSEHIYKWKRFWYPRKSSIRLDYQGYLPDPDSDWGSACNPEIISFEKIVNKPCLVFLGEAGMGKTTAIEDTHKLIYEQVKESDDICLPLFKLGDYDSDTELCNAIFRNQSFKSWLAGTYNLHLFLDSLDEGLLSIKILIRILKRELENLPIDRLLDRLYLRITCRTAEWASSLEGKLNEKWTKDNVGVYNISPLRQVDVIESANWNNINHEDFLREVFNKNAVPLAIKPITLKFLIDIYLKKGNLPSSQVELYEQGCLQLCEECNDDRRDSGFTGKLSPKKRMMVAGRIAAITIFANRSAVWMSSEYGKMPSSDVALRDLCAGKENAEKQNFDVNEDCIKEVLPFLFCSRETNSRMEFTHRTYAEFLAAWYLVQHQIPLTQIKQLIFSSDDPDRKLIPQLHETAAWLASMREDVLQEIIVTDLDVALQSDIPPDVNIRVGIINLLFIQYEQEKIFDREKRNYQNYIKLDHPGLAKQLRPYICDSIKQIDVRDLAIDIAEVCKCSELQDELVNLALDSSQPIYLRASAARAISNIGDEKCKLKLKPLAIGQISTDEDDQLKGYALSAVWPHHLTAKELFSSISSPKQGNFVGSYHVFTNYELVQKLQPNDLSIALKWLERQGIRDIGHPFDGLGDAILIKAWENFELQGVIASFTRLALVKWRAYSTFGCYAIH